MLDILVSVVVPIYNVENYLERCIESILNQTYKKIEIILIDDGSTDSCGSICDKYKKLDSRIVVVHKKNEGLSAARNDGILNSHGDYICFIDSDDVIAVYYIDLLLNNCLKYNAEIAVGIRQRFTDNIEFKITDEKKSIIYNPKEALRLLANFSGIIYEIVTDKLYKTSLFNNIRFPVNLIHEDLGTTYKLLYEANKIVYVNQVVYGHYVRMSSITKSKYSLKRLDILKLSKERVSFFKNQQETELHILFLNNYISVLIETYLDVIINLNNKKIAKEIKKEIYNNIFKVINSRFIKLKHRLKLLFVAIFPFGFQIALIIIKKIKYKN